MSTVFAFVGILLVSLVVGFLAALPLADFFQATEEFILVIMALVAAVLMSLMIFVETNRYNMGLFFALEGDR